MRKFILDGTEFRMALHKVHNGLFVKRACHELLVKLISMVRRITVSITKDRHGDDTRLYSGRVLVDRLDCVTADAQERCHVT